MWGGALATESKRTERHQHGPSQMSIKNAVAKERSDYAGREPAYLKQPTIANTVFVTNCPKRFELLGKQPE